MAGDNRRKLNQILRMWPAGTAATLPWLAQHGVYQQLAYEYERSGWVERIGRGVYRRAGDHVNWQGALHAIQSQLNLPVHVAGKTALELKGFEHFVVAGAGAPLYLFSEKLRSLPTWFTRHSWDRRISFFHVRLFNLGKVSGGNTGLSQHEIGTFSINVSSPERAIFEVLELVPKHQSFSEARLLMEGLTGLRPKVIQTLLEACCSIKVKRLFLHLAERCNHAWASSLNLKKIDLGSGNRVVVPGGRLDTKYRITVDRERVADESEKP